MTKRLVWVDIMKAFSIMAVVLNHTHIPHEAKQLVYLLCLPAFFFVSGIFTNTRLSPIDFFKQKTIRLLVPYATWGILTWIAWFFIGRQYGTDCEPLPAWWYPLWGMVCGKGPMIMHNRPLWFICCLVSLEWIYYGISLISRSWLRWLIIIGLSAIGCILSYRGDIWIWEISSALIILPIYACGAEKNIFWKTNGRNIPLLITIFILIVSLIGIGIGYFFNKEVELNRSIIGNPCLYYLTAISVVGFWFSIAIIIEKYIKRYGILQYIGQNTLLILCTHMSIFGLIKGIALICRIPLPFFETIAGCLVLWIGTFIISLPFSYLLNRFCPTLAGKK